MFKFILFLSMIITLFRNQLWWACHRLSDNDAWHCYLGLFLSFYFIAKSNEAKPYRKINFNHLTLVLILFCLTYSFIPNSIQCFIILMILYIGYCLCLERSLNFNVILLLCFCLPWLTTFQFYLGYPLRLICSYGSILAFKLLAMPVELTGILFSYQDKTIYIDAPCSGIKMLYTGLLFSVVLCNLYNLSFKKTLIFLTLTFILILITNIFRYVILFFGEAGFFYMPQWVHSGVGLLLFLINNTICFYLINNYETLQKFKKTCFLLIKNTLKERAQI